MCNSYLNLIIAFSINNRKLNVEFNSFIILMEDSEFNQIFDLLLMAGYFRVRITGLSPLDKIIGGLAWCITHSYVDVDIEYNDEM